MRSSTTRRDRGGSTSRLAFIWVAAFAAGAFLAGLHRAEASTLTGIMTYDKRASVWPGLQNPQATPIAELPFEIKRVSDGALFASGELGTDGSFSVQIATVGVTELKIVIYLEKTSGVYNFKVHGYDSEDPYCIEKSLGLINTYAYQNIGYVRFSRGPAPYMSQEWVQCRAINIAMCAIAGMRFNSQSLNLARESWQLRFLWANGTNNGAFYQGADNHISLTGDYLGDDDADDDTVIGHEMGHWVLNRWSKDNHPGWYHAGSEQQNMLLAYSEGWATGYGQSVMRRADYADTGNQGTKSGWDDYENQPDVGCHGEDAIAAFFYDIFDDPGWSGSTVEDYDEISILGQSTGTIVSDVLVNYCQNQSEMARLSGFLLGWTARSQPYFAQMLKIAEYHVMDDRYENNNDFATATPVGMNTTVMLGPLITTDRPDYFRFTADRTGSCMVIVDIREHPVHLAGIDLNVYIFQGFSLIASATTLSRIETVTFNATAGMEYYILVFENASWNEGDNTDPCWWTKGYGYYYLSIEGPLIIDGPGACREILADDDVHYYQFTNPAQATLIVEVTNAWGGTLTDSYLVVKDNAGSMIAQDDDRGDGNMSRIVQAFQPGTYKVEVRNARGAKGTYTVSVSSVKVLTAGTPWTGTIAGSRAVNWYSAPMFPDGSFVINTTQGSLTDVFISLYDPDINEPIEEDDDHGAGRMAFIERSVSAATRCIKVRAYDGNATGTYSIVFAPETELVVDGSGADGNISAAGKEQWFKFTNNWSGDRVVEVTNAWEGTLTDSVATLFNGVEEFVTDDEGGDGRMSRLWLAGLSQGTYYVRVRGWSSYTGTYSIAASSIRSPTMWPVAASIAGPKGINWFQVAVSYPEEYRIDTTAGALSDTYMYLYDASHAEPVEEDDDDGDGFMARIDRALSSGTYYVKVRAYWPYAAGSYDFNFGYANAERHVTFTDCTVAPVPVSPGGTIALSGLAGQVKALSPDDWVKVVVGLRDDYGNWVGGEPVVVYSGMPGLNWQNWWADWLYITAPGAEGSYWVWAQLAATTDDATAILWFKSSPVTAENPLNDACANVKVRITRRWTFIVYMNGDSEQESAAINDFLDMASVGSSDDVNVVALFDRIAGYDARYDDWPNTRMGLIHQGSVPGYSWGSNLDDVNMGDPQTLVGFAQWTATNYPAERYALILWDHSRGSVWEAAHDRTSNDTLSVNELKAALAAINRGGLWLDLIGLDTNGMSLAEVAYDLRRYAQIMVASEEMAPGQGWPWASILGQLEANPRMATEALATNIVHDYYEYYGGTYGCAAINLPLMDSLAEQTAALAFDMTVCWDSDWVFVKQAAQNVKDCLLATVLHQHHGNNWPGSCGLAIYFPETFSAFDPAYDRATVDFAAATNWNGFLMVFYEAMGGSWIARSRTMALNYAYPQHADLYHFCDEIVNYTNPELYYVESELANGFIGAGSPTGWQTDDACWQYTLPFLFPFFQQNQAAVWVGSNGYLDFANSLPDYRSNTAALITNQRIAAYMGDLIPNDIYIHQPTGDSVCIRWDAVDFEDRTPVNVEVVLYSDGRIQLNHGSGNAPPSLLPIVGIAKGNAVDFYLAACNGSPSLGYAQSVLWTPVQPEVTLTACTITPNPAPPRQIISLSDTAGQVKGVWVEETDTIVIGFRDRSGNWVGGEPVVVWAGVAGTEWQAWSGERPAMISAPTRPGTCWVWVKLVPTADPDAAIKSFKDGTPAAEDAVNKKWGTALLVQAAPAAPTSFTHPANAINSITWAWLDNSDNEIGFRVDPPGGTVGPDVQSWTEPGLAANTAYTRHVHAYNVSGDSTPSNDHTAYTSIEACTGVTFGAVTASSIQASSTNTPSGLSRGSSGLILRNKTKATDSGWKQDNALWTSGSLLANKAYQFTAQSRNGDAETTAETAAATKYTLPIAPNVTCNRSAGTPYPQTTVFTFTNAAGWADGGVNHYHYVFDTSAATAPTSSSSSWSSGSLAQTPAVGSWYLHLMSHNAEHAGGGTAHLGPYVVGYTLTVNNGTGSGAYASGMPVTITATVPSGYRFDKWTGNTANVANVNAASTTITMLANATVTATFVQIGQQFTLTVINGTGSGTYDSNTVVHIVASVPLGYHFHNWTGDTANVADVNAASTTITMLANAVVTATFGLDGDVNDDSCVNVADLLIVRNNLGRSGSSIYPPWADVNADGICNVADLLLVRNRLGQGTCR